MIHEMKITIKIGIMFTVLLILKQASLYASDSQSQTKSLFKVIHLQYSLNLGSH